MRPAAASTSSRGCCSEPMKAALGQTVIVENRTGASAMIATGAVAKAPPDGYMLLMAASGEVAINHFLFKEKMAYDPAEGAGADRAGRHRALRRGRRRRDAGAQSEGADRLRQGQSRQAVVLVVGRRQSAATGRRTDEQHGRHPGAARAVSRLGAGGDRRRDRRRHHELLEPRGGAAADQGRQDCARSRSPRASACRNCRTSRR